PSAPMRWAGAAIDVTDPVLPDGALALANYVKAPNELARRLRQIGVIAREDASRLMPLLKPGQRLVSREGDLWRWDGFSVAANAPRRRPPPAAREEPGPPIPGPASSPGAARGRPRGGRCPWRGRRPPPRRRPRRRRTTTSAPCSTKPWRRAGAMPRPSARRAA